MIPHMNPRSGPRDNQFARQPSPRKTPAGDEKVPDERGAITSMYIAWYEQAKTREWSLSCLVFVSLHCRPSHPRDGEVLFEARQKGNLFSACGFLW